MTFGEKLKDARQKAHLSQEELATKLSVSRSAIAKWEGDRGMPDIDNLKAISQLLEISIDYLLDEEGKLDFTVTKEAIDLDSYKAEGRCRNKYEAAVYSKYPDADSIYPLIREKVLSKTEQLLEWTVMPGFGLFTAVDQINNPGDSYLVTYPDKQYLVFIDKEQMVTTQLMRKITEQKFVIGKNKYKRINYNIIK